MAAACKRGRKRLRLKSGKKVNNSFVRELWKDYINLSILPMLLKYGKVQIDKNCSLEIVGHREIKLIKLKRNGKISSTTLENKLRSGISYKIVLNDRNYRGGTLIFQACPMIKKAVSDHLKNSNTYYRIAA